MYVDDATLIAHANELLAKRTDANGVVEMRIGQHSFRFENLKDLQAYRDKLQNRVAYVDPLSPMGTAIVSFRRAV